MRIMGESDQGVIIELSGHGGFRMVGNNGVMSPIFHTPEPIAQKMPYTDWIPTDKPAEPWLKAHDISVAQVLEGPPK